MNYEEHNKQCAEVLGWEYSNGGFYIAKLVNKLFKDSTTNCSFVKDMHFHDSYDWAMLLVAKVVDIYGECPTTFKLNELIGNWVTKSPLQISTACLAVLKVSIPPQEVQK